jgi:hypothetical protein
MHSGSKQAAWQELQRRWRGDFTDRDIVNGRLTLTPDESAALQREAERLHRDSRDISPLHRGGHRIAVPYDATTLHWTTVSRTVSVGGKRVFMLCNFPGSWLIRLWFTCKLLSQGIPSWRPFSRGWKRRIESHSMVPVFTVGHRRVVALPFVDSVNLYDILAGAPTTGAGTSFAWTQPFAVADLLAACAGVGRQLAIMHGPGRAWGDPTAYNVALDGDRVPLLLDMEMGYVGLSFGRQKKMDLQLFIDDAHVEAKRWRGWDDRAAIEKAVMDGYRSATA